MIYFTQLRYKNFLASGNFWTSIDLSGKQNTLIIGANGSGKSTMLDALCFGLFGKAFRDINKGQLVNSINQKDCSVEILFSANGKEYKIIRGIKPNIFEIYQDDIKLNQDSNVKDYQEILEKTILKFNYKSFTQIVILGSASFVPFMQLTTADRRIIIEDLLDIQIFSIMNTIVKDRINNNKDLVSLRKSKIELLTQRYNIEKKHLESLKEDNNQKVLEYQQDIEKYKDISSKVSEDVAKMIVISEQLQSYINERIDTKESIKKFTKLETTIEGKLLRLRKDLNFFNETGNCPTCRQTIDEQFKRDEINKLEKEVSEIQVGLKRLEEKINNEQKIINELNLKQTELQKVQMKIATSNTTINETNKFISRLNIQISNLLKNDTKEIEDHTVLNSISEELEEMKKDLEELINDKAYFDIASLLLKDNGIKTQIIKQYLPIINKLVNKYLTIFEFFVNFNLDESFKETIKSRHRDEFTYNNFSEGQKQRIDMALLLTWRDIAKLKNSSHTNILILDEIFDSSLDDSGAEMLMKTLANIDNNLFVITHRADVISEKFQKIIKFSLKGNFSKMEVL